MRKRKGKLIVIDGVDGSGKATQTKLLLTRLRKAGLSVKTLSFPRYQHNFFGRFIGSCLRGEHGDFALFDPYVASALYAADRYESKKQIEAWLTNGITVVLDRYVSSNQIHQGGKIPDLRKRNKFFIWLERLEYTIFGLPRPDVTICLDVPLSISMRLSRAVSAQKKKQYLTSQKKKDVVEWDRDYPRRSYQSAQHLMKHAGWHRIPCTTHGKLKTPKEINDLIFERVKRILKLS